MNRVENWKPIVDKFEARVSEWKARSVSYGGRLVDSWRWIYATDGIFNTKKLFELIEYNGAVNTLNTRSATIHNFLVPLKVEIFVWRLLKRRLPVRVELDKRAIDLHSTRCPVCDDDIESIDPIFIFCKFTMEVWDRVYKWWNLGFNSNLSLNEVFRGKTNRAMSYIESIVWQAVEWTCGYILWKHRNLKVFTRVLWCVVNTLLEIQLKSFEWISLRYKKKKID
ncbi:uncharacterized protein [Rutidosis leptorrhynchoides]|uniref:uncharacterized protein n=1 Tax=Rutidosis leptorrhynchoides TaxID=125765 RepID=UPI003A9A3DE4